MLPAPSRTAGAPGTAAGSFGRMETPRPLVHTYRMDRNQTRWTFPFGDALPAGDLAARFVVSIGAALNDLVFLNRLYVPDQQWSLLRREGTPSENAYLIRLVASAVFELCRLLDKGRQHETVRILLGRLDGEGIQDLRQFIGLSGLRPRVEEIRNFTSHYPWPEEATLESALTALADTRTDFEADLNSMAYIRANFADEVLLQAFGNTDEELRALISGLADLVTTAIRLCQRIVVEYLASLPGGIVTHQAPDE